MDADSETRAEPEVEIGYEAEADYGDRAQRGR